MSAGILGLLRLVPEYIQVVNRAPQVDYRYFVLITADALVAWFGAVSGFGLLKGKPWVWPLCAVFWGAGAAGSAFMEWVAVPELIQAFHRGISIQQDGGMLPRCLYYAVMIVTAPFAFRILLVKERPSAVPLPLLLFVSATSSGVFYFLLIFGM